MNAFTCSKYWIFISNNVISKCSVVSYYAAKMTCFVKLALINIIATFKVIYMFRMSKLMSVVDPFVLELFVGNEYKLQS